MKEREPDFENEKIRAWLMRPSLEGRVEKEPDFEGLEKDPTVITIDEETEEIFESRAYHFRPGPETFSFLLGSLAQTMGADVVEIPPQELVDHIMDMIKRIQPQKVIPVHTEDPEAFVEGLQNSPVEVHVPVLGDAIGLGQRLPCVFADSAVLRKAITRRLDDTHNWVPSAGQQGQTHPATTQAKDARATYPRDSADEVCRLRGIAFGSPVGWQRRAISGSRLLLSQSYSSCERIGLLTSMVEYGIVGSGITDEHAQ